MNPTKKIQPGLVSIIVPCYNYAHFLPETLKSVSAQSFQNWECIIVDDGSSDNTSEVAAGFRLSDSRFRSISQPNRGPAAARNTGIQESVGEYIQFLDADDLITPEKLKSQIAYLEKNRFVDIVYGDIQYFQHDRNRSVVAEELPDNSWTPMVSGIGEEILKFLIIGNITVVSSPLTRYSVFSKCGGFDESLTCLEDWAFWFECALNNFEFAYDVKPGKVTNIRWHPQSLSRDKENNLETAMELRNTFHIRLPDKILQTLNADRYAHDAIDLFKFKLPHNKFEALKTLADRRVFMFVLRHIYRRTAAALT